MSTFDIYRSRTNTVVLDYADDPDLSSDTFTAQIRATNERDGTLLATFAVDTSDAATGTIVFTLDNSVTADITADYGYFDVERVIDSEPTTVFPPMRVRFVEVVTTS